MAVNTRLSAPSYKIFEPDALDVMLAQHTLDPLQGGLAGSMMLTHRLNTDTGQQQFMESNDRFNNLAKQLDAYEIQQKTQEAAMKIGGSLVEKGARPSGIRGMENVFYDPNSASADELPGLQRGVLSAKINADNARAAADHSGMMDTYKETYVDPGTNKVVEVTHKGKPGTVTIPSRPNVDPQGSTPMPTSANAPAVNTQQTIQRAMASVGATSPGQMKMTPDGKGNVIVSNLTNPNKTAIFDTQGKQLR